jgi:hypothetical protein
MAFSNATSSIATPCPKSQHSNDGLPDLDAAQFIWGTNIDPSKLTALLRTKFGAGAFDTHVSVCQPSERVLLARQLC